jgi:hypothetical protein
MRDLSRLEEDALQQRLERIGPALIDELEEIDQDGVICLHLSPILSRCLDAAQARLGAAVAHRKYPPQRSYVEDLSFY